MKVLPLLFLTLALPLGAVARETDEHPSEKKPGLVNRLLHPFRKGSPAEAGTAKGNWRRLELTMALEPLPLKLAETRQLKVTLTLVNHSGKFVQLDFPTSQRIEVLVKTNTGKLVEQWSEDHSFESDPGVVSVNPGERLTYSITVATRDMVAGETYRVEGFFPNFDKLRAEKTIVPEK